MLAVPKWLTWVLLSPTWTPEESWTVVLPGGAAGCVEELHQLPGRVGQLGVGGGAGLGELVLQRLAVDIRGLLVLG